MKIEEVNLGHGHDIKDYDLYNSSMQKSVNDKLFFLGMIDDDITQIVDYGCADGSMLANIKHANMGLDLIGYDIDDNMIALCKSKGVDATTDYDSIENKESSLINLSSIIHEIFSYCSKTEIKEFWQRVFHDGYKNVAIRDMMLTRADFNKPTDQEDLRLVKQYCNDNDLNTHLEQFQDIHGSIELQGHLVHYLLKYRYLENWDREVREDYLPIDVEDFRELIPPANYNIEYFDHNVLPFAVRQIKKDIGITLTVPTHIKAFLSEK